MREHLHRELEAQKYVVFVNGARLYVDCSDAACELVGYERSEILKKNIEELSYNRTEVSALYQEYMRAGLLDGEYILRHKNGDPILIRYRAWVFADGCQAAVWSPAEEWRQLYLAALVETHPFRLKEKINLAMSAIQRRRADLNDGEDLQLLQKLRDAHAALGSLLRS